MHMTQIFKNNELLKMNFKSKMKTMKSKTKINNKSQK